MVLVLFLASDETNINHGAEIAKYSNILFDNKKDGVFRL